MSLSLLSAVSDISQEELEDIKKQITEEFTLEECQGELLDAARYDDIDVLRALLSCHFQLLDHQEEQSGNSALHMAAANGHVRVVELLLALGAKATVTNKKGNTPLHWAASNGQTAVVELLVKNEKTDVLQRNAFGRSALTEGFSSENTEVVKTLLEHESASEERLMESTVDGSKDATAVTHSLVFGRTTPHPVKIQARELAMATSRDDAILGQQDPDDDTTGLGIWVASLIAAQWMSRLAQDHPIFQKENIVALELGSGCGVPGLVLAAAMRSKKIYLTDFNQRSLDNLQHNVGLLESHPGTVETLHIDWQDSKTWPKEPVDVLVGSDLIYQSDMVPALIQTVRGLLKQDGVFFYVSPETGRQGQEDLFSILDEYFVVSELEVPKDFLENPLESQDDEECFLHFNEISTGAYKLNEIKWKVSNEPAGG